MPASKTEQFYDTKEEILRMNALGFSAASIARKLGMHHTSVSHRLTRMGIKPNDTRRSFMEEIFEQLPENQVNWVADEIGIRGDVRRFIAGLINDAYRAARPN
jgi:DNA-binding CsgD family transcriptional regulator